MSTAEGPLPVAWVRQAVARYPLPDDARVTFIRHGENTTYRVEAGDQRFALRLHRPGYQSLQGIRSELAWMDSLRESGIPTPVAVRGRDGDAVQSVESAGRHLVMFKWTDGIPLNTTADVEPWTHLGEMMARIHEHDRSWKRPEWFERPSWDAGALVGDDPRWGPPDPHHVLAPADHDALEACRRVVAERLNALGSSPTRYGLIHGDLGFENALVLPDGRVTIIDFDDCGESWHVHELAVALYPEEGRDGFEARRDAVVTGYRRQRPIEDELLHELPTFLMARRIATLGWVFSRPDTDHAQRQRARRLMSTPRAARAYLGWAERTPVPSGATGG
jgi:Ser/Thr protein kinase RdoA (MazF antagonist)